MKYIIKFFEWLMSEFKYDWFEGSNITFIFCMSVLVGLVVICCNKKLRKKFF